MGKYTKMYTEMHQKQRYGTSSERLLPYIQKHKPLGAVRVLDYGCGQSRMLKDLNPEQPVWYDPSVEGKNKKPVGSMDWVICTDVAEHVPEEEIDEFLADVFSYSKNVFMTISLVPAFAKLPNGENAHCTVKSKEWWYEKLKQYTDRIREIEELTTAQRLAIKTY